MPYGNAPHLNTGRSHRRIDVGVPLRLRHDLRGMIRVVNIALNDGTKTNHDVTIPARYSAGKKTRRTTRFVIHIGSRLVPLYNTRP